MKRKLIWGGLPVLFVLLALDPNPVTFLCIAIYTAALLVWNQS